ncbi:MAG: SURF1 family protein [Rickettsiales bacterium]
MIRFHKPRPVAWLFFITGLAVTLGLGTWQVQRLQWKENLLATIAQANTDAPLIILPATETELKPLEFRRVSIKGTWVPNVEFTLLPRYFKGTVGYWVITPLKLTDGRVLLVNRGWVPTQKKDAEKRPETSVKGRATVDGLLRVGPERSTFTPKNQPERNLWFGRDMAEMAANAKLENVVPAMLDVVGTQDVTHLPVPSDGIIRLRNDHLSYILTWYGIALGMLVIFVVYHRKK